MLLKDSQRQIYIADLETGEMEEFVQTHARFSKKTIVQWMFNHQHIYLKNSQRC